MTTESLADAATTERPLGRSLIRCVVTGRDYQVFDFEQGFLFLDRGRCKTAAGQTGRMIGAMLAGRQGAFLGEEVENFFRDDFEPGDPSLEHRSNDELLALARKSRHSFVVAHRETEWAKLEKTGMFGVLTGDETIGKVTLKEMTVGRVCMEIYEPHSMMNAIHVFPRYLGDRATVKIRLNESTCKFEAV